MRKRWLRIVAWSLLILLVLPSAALLCERLRGSIALARYKRQLHERGEKLAPRDMMLPPSEGENGAPEAIALAGQLQRGATIPLNPPPALTLTPAGRAIVGFREEEWFSVTSSNCWEDVAADLTTNQMVLDQIGATLKKPILENNLDFAKAPNLPLLHLSPVKQVAQWFGARCEFALHDGDTHQAVEALASQLNATRLLAQDRVLISELVRIAIAAIARANTWEALQADGWSDEDLSRLQLAWEGLQFAPAMARALEGEMVFQSVTFESLRRSNPQAAKILFAAQDFLGKDDLSIRAWERWLLDVPGGREALEFVRKQVYCRVWRYAWLDQAEVHDLQNTHRLLEINRDAVAGKSLAGIQPALARLEEDGSNKNLYDRLRYPNQGLMFSLSRCLSRAMRAETDRSMVICALVLKRYSLRHSKPPVSLDALVPEFLSAVPIDYMDGQPLRYKLLPDGNPLLYSVGKDGKDDGGDATLLPGMTSRRNPWDRKDVVWPLPATPEEVKAYRNKEKATFRRGY